MCDTEKIEFIGSIISFVRSAKEGTEEMLRMIEPMPRLCCAGVEDDVDSIDRDLDNALTHLLTLESYMKEEV